MATDTRIPDAIDAFLTQLRADLDAHGATLAATLLEHSQEQARDEVPEPAGSTRLLEAVRRLDESSTLSGILEVLAKGAADEAPRVAVLLVEPDGFKVWGHFGFAGGQGPSDFAIGRVPQLTTTVMTRQTPIIWMDDAAATDMPEFMQPSEGEAGLIAPLVVGGEVVGVVYAAGGAQRTDYKQTPVWAEQVELLVRHAAARLENVTSARTVASLTRRA